MGDTIRFGKSLEDESASEQAEKLGLRNAGVDMTYVRTYVDEYTAIDKTNNWQIMSMSTAQGAAALNRVYFGATFDGKYVYFAPNYSDTFLRFNTQGTSFITVTDWQTMSLSTAQGAALLDVAYAGACFDGRYVYFGSANSATSIRFDTQGTSFTTAADWQKISISTAQGAAATVAAYYTTTFDGRYVYFVPFYSDTFIRFDTQGTSFTTEADWTQMSMSTAHGGVSLNDAYYGVVFDGRYVYFTPFYSDTFIRFDTQGTSFTTAGDWQKVSVSTAQGAAALDQVYIGAGVSDGSYIYFSPYYSDTFIRVLATPET